MKSNALIILLVVILLIVTAWILIRIKNKPVTVPEGAQADQIFFNPCSVNIEGKKFNADCGMLVVSENRINPDANLIALPIKRIHSTNPSPLDPIFFLDGGPGQSNMKFKPPAWMLENHDVILVGYRGVDGTPRLDCPEVSTALKGKTDDLLSPASLDGIGAALKACSDRLSASGIDLRGYMIPQVVEDMESARRLLGYERINLLSQSYGTRVAQIFAEMHPKSLFRSVMLGANPPGHFVTTPEVVDSLIMDYGTLWKKQTGDSAPDLAAAMRSMNANMPSHWLFLPIDPGKVKVVAFSLLSHSTTAPITFDTYLTAAKGDPSGLAFMTLAYDLIMPKLSTWGEFFVIGCSADYEPERDYRAELSSRDPIMGSPLSMLIWGSAAGNWPPILMEERYRRVNPSDVETLLVNGNLDFSTPAQFTETELLPSLTNAQSIRLKDMGHTNDFWGFQAEARQKLITSFYATGKADASLYETIPLDFTPKLRFPVFAKILVGLSFVLLVGLGWLVWNTCHLKRRNLASNKK